MEPGPLAQCLPRKNKLYLAVNCFLENWTGKTRAMPQMTYIILDMNAHRSYIVTIM
jgi:hypothetical protein